MLTKKPTKPDSGISSKNIYNFSPASNFFFPYLTHMLVSFSL